MWDQSIVSICMYRHPFYFLSKQEAGLEKELVNLLCKLSAQHHMPTLAHHRVTTKTLRHMSASDLRKVSSAYVLDSRGS